MAPTGLSLSRTTKESIKTALAMVLAYAIALQSGWEKPLWAGIAVAVISQQPLGLSLNKGALRMVGTLAAALMAITIIALFPQQRWLFMVALSTWVGICTYMMLGSSRAYLWQIGGFVSVIICVSAATTPLTPFEVAITRTQETALGVLVYSLVALLLWPCESRGQFFTACNTLNRAQLALCRQCCVVWRTGNTEAAQQLGSLREDVIHAQSAFNTELEAAIADTPDLREVGGLWRTYQKRASDVTATLVRVSESLNSTWQLPLDRLVPQLPEFTVQLGNMLEQTGMLLQGRKAAVAPDVPDLSIDASALQTLSLYDAGTLAVLRDQLVSLASQAHAMQSAVSTALKGEARAPLKQANALKQANDSPAQWLMPDPDRVAASLRVMLILWVAYLSYLYIDGFPGGAVFVMIAGSLAMSLATMPQVSPAKLLIPVLTSILLSSLIYFFVMPNLSGFAELGLLLFAVTFLSCQLFSGPEKAAGRLLLLVIFISLAGISNQQSFSFMHVATLALMWPLLVILLGAAAYFPSSPRPEKVFLRLLRQFFCSGASILRLLPCEHVSDGHFRFGGQWRALRVGYHCHLLATIPAKLAIWANLVEGRFQPDRSGSDLQRLAGKIEALGYEIRALAEESQQTLSTELMPDTATEPGEWRAALHRALIDLAEEVVRSGIEGTVGVPRQREEQLRSTTLEDAIKLVSAGSKSPATEELERALRLLGLTQGVGASLQGVREAAGRIDWSEWQEQRFY